VISVVGAAELIGPQLDELGIEHERLDWPLPERLPEDLVQVEETQTGFRLPTWLLFWKR
jgi:hypothetical protein